MKKLIVLLCFMIVSVTTYAQSHLTEEQVIQYTQLAQELEGTFQIQMIDTRATPAITLDLFPQIAELRHESEVTYLNVNPSMRIMILPLSSIESPSYQEVERVTRINSSEL